MEKLPEIFDWYLNRYISAFELKADQYFCSFSLRQNHRKPKQQGISLDFSSLICYIKCRCSCIVAALRSFPTVSQFVQYVEIISILLINVKCKYSFELLVQFVRMLL